MKRHNNSNSSGQNSLNTLVQKGTAIMNNPVVVVRGEGTDMNNKKALKGRAKKKIITNKLMLALIDLAYKIGDKISVKAFWNTYHCQNRLISSENKLYGKYCKNRFCTVCNSIRKAEMIHKYLPVLKTQEQPYFVVLTVRSCSKAHFLKLLRQ
ncbi:MAG: hypothetical protein IPL31_17775 [Saprospiraceae bacterium]|nr:hypothetical protein [Saprospiraceae bacterium]